MQHCKPSHPIVAPEPQNETLFFIGKPAIKAIAEKMTKRYSILQKKLQKLESVLSALLSLPPDRNPHYYQVYSEDIKQRLVFLRNLLSAEVASRPNRPHHLTHIAQRLTELEATFQEWDGCETQANGVLLDHVDTVSMCSCTESCLNDDGEASNETGSPSIEENDDQFFLEQKVTEETEKPEDEREEKEKKRVQFGECIRASAGGFVLGAALMGYVMVGFSGCFDHVHHVCSLPPT